MRHLKRTAKLGRTGDHRNAMLANLVCSLIIHKRVTTTLAKAKAARSVAEKIMTLGKNGTLHDRRLAAARLHQEDAVRILFNELAPAAEGPRRRLHPHPEAQPAPGRRRPARHPRVGGPAPARGSSPRRPRLRPRRQSPPTPRRKPSPRRRSRGEEGRQKESRR